MNSYFKDFLLKNTQAKDCKEIEMIQSLWSGYGKISRIQLDGAAVETVVVKHISLVKALAHPRGWNTDNSHNRKVKSYQVETNWYENYNQRCTSDCRTPRFLASFSRDQDQWIVLEDLDTQYPLRKQHLKISEVKICLKWLANFHATFLNEKPEGLWEIGTYWHLATRPDEFASMKASELKDKAKTIDEILNNCQYQTFVHGDAKVANFCFSNDENSVAAVDFQYVGGGCGMKDLAYFLGSCLTGTECQNHEAELLDFYFNALEVACQNKISPNQFIELEQEWRRMYPIASADFTRFLMGWMPGHEKVNGYSLGLLDEVLADF
ncbi:oxidoreductase family protein [Brumimicrobium oceani]|uniref:Choline kinase n=1 Tax=Brumimicrobium oceani TaxID=2100725 RepID=A0A2U2XFZ6_9FLAO|nr:oxidoreductase family protein [Brumimicrobium oceani]PWH86728.1 choline kinase [Brumimicrobium oceani]